MSEMFIPREKIEAETDIPPRDWLLLPMVGLLTIGFLVVAAEWLSRRAFPKSTTDIYTCLAGNRTADGVLDGMHGIPYAACEGNNRDTPVTRYRLNALGHREETLRSPKPAGVYRIVMLGSSVAFGEGVPSGKAFANLLPEELSRTTGRPIELYNAGMFGEVPDVIAQHFEQVFPLQPDLILWVLTAHDIKDTFPRNDTPARSAVVSIKSAPSAQGSLVARIQRSVRGAFTQKTVAQATADLWQHAIDHIYGTSSAVVFLQHLLYQNETQYLRSFLESGDAASLRKPLRPDWQDHLKQFRQDDARVEAAAQKAHVPLVVVLLPNAAQAIMISARTSPDGFDPYVLNANLRDTVLSDGGEYIDIFPSLQTLSNAGQYFFQVNGHPNDAGHAQIAKMLRRSMTAGPAALLPSAQPPRAMVR